MLETAAYEVDREWGIWGSYCNIPKVLSIYLQGTIGFIGLTG